MLAVVVRNIAQELSKKDKYQMAELPSASVFRHCPSAVFQIRLTESKRKFGNLYKRGASYMRPSGEQDTIMEPSRLK